MKIQLGDHDLNVIHLESTQLDCSELFTCEPTVADGTTVAAGEKTYKLKHNKKSKVLKLDALDCFRTTTENKFEFLPTKIYVRDCMQEIFHKIVEFNDVTKYCVIFGSPGVGKSVLSFLAALCFVRYKEKPLLFLRKTTKIMEDISVFWITPGSDGKLKVEFDRQVYNGNKLETVHWKMLRYILNDDLKSIRNHEDHLRSICDGPRHRDADHVGSSDLVTCDFGYEDVKDEAMDEIYALPLSAWTMKEVILGCRHLFDFKAQDVKDIFYVCGGNICRMTAVINKKQTLSGLQKRIDRLVDSQGSLKALKLALISNELSSDENSIDRLRSMFAVRGDGKWYTAVQYMGSPYLFRKVRSSLSLKQTLDGLRRAKNSGIQSLYGWHFELFGHKIFQLSHKHIVDTKSPNNPSPAPKVHEFKIVEGKGTGKESVAQLDDIGAYWTPSISNFANIDAAIALGDILYCIQYTVAKSHTFNFRTFASNFWGVLPTGFRDQITKIIVVFVVPHEQTFKKVVIPKSQETLSAVDNSTCCDGLEMVFRKGKKNGGDDEVEESGPDGDVEMSSSNGDDDSTFSDDDCGEEGFDDEHDQDGTDDDDTSISTLVPIHFKWEERSETFNADQAPLSFLIKNDSM